MAEQDLLTEQPLVTVQCFPWKEMLYLCCTMLGPVTVFSNLWYSSSTLNLQRRFKFILLCLWDFATKANPQMFCDVFSKVVFCD